MELGGSHVAANGTEKAANAAFEPIGSFPGSPEPLLGFLGEKYGLQMGIWTEVAAANEK